MVNILIADDNIYYAKTLMNTINKNSQDVRVINIAVDGEEVIENLNSINNIDIVLLDLKMPGFNGIEVLQQLSRDKRKKYKNSIIIISEEIEMIMKLKNDPVVYGYIAKSSYLFDIISKINELVIYKEEEKNSKKIKIAIIEELKKLNYNFLHKGTTYLIDAIFLIYTKNMQDELNLKKNVYPILANKYNQKNYRIKTNITKATDYMDSVCNAEKKRKYFGFNDNTKPTVKVVIYTILNNIDRNLKNYNIKKEKNI